MKDIGILTFHAAHNYGSALQAYALQRKLNELSSERCEIINFSTDKQKEMYSLLCKNNSIKSLLKNIRATSYKYSVIKNRRNDFDRFIKDKLPLSDKEYKSSYELEADIKKYSIIVCGSDQIWNPSTIDFDMVYFLPYSGNIKKVSYAPSIGGGNTLNNSPLKDEIIYNINKFDMISVREEMAKDILSKITDKDIDIVLDPTMLLSNIEWDQICSSRIINEEYIFLYSIDYNDDVVRIAKSISKKLNLPIVILFTSSKTYKTIFKGFTLCEKESPSDFLSLIKHAKLVLSNSFHGNVFSIIYKKPFYAIRGTNNGKINNDNRISTLLNKLDLNDRQLNMQNYSQKQLDLNVNYPKVDKIINVEREKSINYLMNAIK